MKAIEAAILRLQIGSRICRGLRWSRGEHVMKRPLDYLGDGQEDPIPGVTVRIALSFVGVVLFSVGIGLNTKFNLDYPMAIGALLLPVGAYLAFTTRQGCAWQRRLVWGAFLINTAGTLFVIWLLCTASLNRAT